jgi:hypothetical protein
MFLNFSVYEIKIFADQVYLFVFNSTLQSSETETQTVTWRK